MVPSHSARTQPQGHRRARVVVPTTELMILKVFSISMILWFYTPRLPALAGWNLDGQIKVVEWWDLVEPAW